MLIAVLCLIGIQISNNPIISESDTAREDLMNTLKLGAHDYTSECISITSINPLLEAYGNLWSSLEQCKGMLVKLNYNYSYTVAYQQYCLYNNKALNSHGCDRGCLVLSHK